MNKKIFDIVILNGRPAAGKSEILDFLKKVPVAERRRRFHVGEFLEIDDFPILWERFEDDDIMEEMGQKRLISDKTFLHEGKTYPGYIFKEQWYWNFLIRKINRAYEKQLRDQPSLHEKRTVFLEFSRGSEHGGFRSAYAHLSEAILVRAVTLYIHVTFEESLRKNRRRFNPDKPDSVLQHSLEDQKMAKLYRDSDWEDFAAVDEKFLRVGDRRVPYAVFDNMPEKTDRPDVLGPYLEKIMSVLWQRQKEIRS